MFEELKMKK